MESSDEQKKTVSVYSSSFKRGTNQVRCIIILQVIMEIEFRYQSKPKKLHNNTDNTDHASHETLDAESDSVAEELGMTNVSHESLADISGTELPTGIEYDIGKLHHARVK